MVEHHQSRTRRDCLEDGTTDEFRRRAGERDPSEDQARAGPRGDVLQRIGGRVVGMIERDDLVAVPKLERPGDRVDADRRIRHEREVVRRRADEAPQRAPRLIHRRLEVAREEGDGLSLHARAPGGLRLEHRPRRGAERAMVQEDGRRVERPVRGELGWHPAGIVRPMPPPRRPAAILFDLDGTLVDTVPARIDAWIAALDENGIPATREQLAPLIGMDGRRLAREVAGAVGRPLTDEEAEAIDSRSGEHFDERNRDPRPLPGARELLRGLDARGLTWAIATSSRREQVAASIRGARSVG